MIDDIVFDQKQLDNAIERGCRKICLCDNSFTLPCTDGVSYMGIGDVKAVIRLDKGRRYNISFDGFEPTIIYTGGYTGITEQAEISCPDDVVVCGSYGSGSASGSGGSYMHSIYQWGSGSYTGSGIALSSYVTSYTTSYTTSYRTSWVGSYTSSGSSQLIFSAPYCTKEVQRPVFYAAGYGLNLI